LKEKRNTGTIINVFTKYILYKEMTHVSNANNNMSILPEVRDAAEDPLPSVEGAVGVGAVGLGAVGLGAVGPEGFSAGIIFTGIRGVGAAVGPTVGPGEPVGFAETEGDAVGYLEVVGLAEPVGAGDMEGIAERLSPKQPQGDMALA
jgi:hypothetical protein